LPHRVTELVDEERVAERGAHKTNWFVRVGDAWVAAAKVEGATTELETRPAPGVIFRRHTRVALARGTRVLQVERMPLTISRTPLEHLTRGRSTPQRTKERVYSIGSHGELVPEAAPAR
jgi:hypothetical protein